MSCRAKPPGMDPTAPFLCVVPCSLGSRSRVPFALPPWAGQSCAGPEFLGWLLALGLCSSCLSWVLQCFAECLAPPQGCAPTGLSLDVPRTAAVSHLNPPDGILAQPSVLSWASASPPHLPAVLQRWELCELFSWHPLPRSLCYFTAAHTCFVEMCFVNQVYVGWCWENSV